MCAGSLDTFQIFVWSVKTRRLLDVLAGHTSPVVGLAFSPKFGLLASVSWDRTVRTWDVFDGKGGCCVGTFMLRLLDAVFVRLQTSILSLRSD